MDWIILVLSGLFETAGVMMISRWHMTKKGFDLLGMIVSFMISFVGLTYALETISMGTAYAIWTGIGAAGGVLVGMLFFHEPKDRKRIFFLLLIIGSVVGLKLIS
ncbi:MULTISPECIES: DMT family transporter [Gracilibacillus]|uniref:QacE family quaternary ammonium compound efflux SMR transporter n=1 Tax=Gracilibacillus dipsosauri TaxID=178340 RepID=A0A317L2R0_9BACI|nr:multidrug efflux SMR transporter [Gracilibacillus dipsosauri]PWU70171.1 QacE family quaternary ammonium compound efflux SMR transporter [Gracilibacillus dipsosauri]